MPRLGLVVAVLVASAFATFTTLDAEARAERSTRTVLMTAAAIDTPATGRLRFNTHHGATFVSASFTHLAPDALHTVHWDTVGQDGAQFVTNHHGRARLRHVAVPDAAATGDPQVSITDANGDPVLTCDPTSMPSMHDQATTGSSTDHAAHHDAGGTNDMTGMMSDHGGMCSQACMDHCTNGGTCDEQCHQDHGCTAGSCCCGGMSSGSSGGSSSGGTSHSSGMSGGMMSGSSSGMHGSGGGTMMKR